MMKKSLFFAMGLSSVVAFAQDGNVGINNENPSATLSVKSKTGKDAKTKNLQLENAESAKLVTVLDNGNVGIGVENPAKKLEVAGAVKIADGTQGAGKVLTSDASGNATWQSISQTINNNVTYSVTSQVDYNILGYIPSTTATAGSAAEYITIGNTLARKKGTFTYNGHSYATYLAEQTISWYDAYNAAKAMGGYLATFTTDEEWQNVEQNLLDNDTSFDTNYAWIGFVKFSWFAGVSLTPDPEMKWITGEQPRHDYSAGGTNAVRKSNWFNLKYPNGLEPNNSQGGEGFVHTYRKNDGQTRAWNEYTSRHPWNDIPATGNVNFNGVSSSVKAFIVEFQQ